MRATCKNNKKEIGGLRLIWLGRIFKEPKKQLKRMGNYSLIGRFVVCRRLGCELEEVFLLENTFVWGGSSFVSRKPCLINWLKEKIYIFAK